MTKKSATDKAFSIARGLRLRSIRESLRYSRKELGEKYQISAASIQNWEDARYGGLTEKGAKKMLEAYAAEGVECRLEWLFYGVGEEPVIPNQINKNSLFQTSISEEDLIAQELRFFHQINKEAVDTVVTDDGMGPCLMPGDQVAGRRFFAADIELAIGKVSIVQTLAGHILVRMVKKGQAAGHFTLLCTNPTTKVQQPVLLEQQLFSAAPILWIRKKPVS